VRIPTGETSVEVVEVALRLGGRAALVELVGGSVAASAAAAVQRQQFTDHQHLHNTPTQHYSLPFTLPQLLSVQQVGNPAL